MITKSGKFHYDTLKAQLLARDSCVISSSTEDAMGFVSHISINPSSPEKEAELQTVLDAHDAEKAVAQWNAKKQRISSAAGEMCKIPQWSTWSAQEAANSVETTVTDLAQAKQVLKALAMMVCYLRDHGGVVA